MDKDSEGHCRDMYIGNYAVYLQMIREYEEKYGPIWASEKKSFEELLETNKNVLNEMNTEDLLERDTTTYMSIFNDHLRLVKEYEEKYGVKWNR